MSVYSDEDRAQEIVSALAQDDRFRFKDQGGFLRFGVCPNCGKKELYVRKSEPWRIACGRENKCGMAWTAKELLPQLFENYVKRFPPTRENPKATAEAYLREDRAFTLNRIRGWFEQESHMLKGSGEYVPTVRFYLDLERTRFWERLIGKTKADGQKAHIGGKRKPDGTLFQHDAWTPPGQELQEGDTCFITEGIFHAIALEHAGKPVAAALSSSNFPKNLIEQNKGKKITWILALDGDKAGRKAMCKHRDSIIEMGETVEICLLPDGKKDWDDLWKDKQLTDDAIENYLHEGKLFTAGSPAEKAWLTLRKSPHLAQQVIEFKNALYTVSIKGEEALGLGLDAFERACNVRMISNVSPAFLYIERNELMGTQTYVFQVKYKNGTPTKVMGLEGSNFVKAEPFHKALLNNTNGGEFIGDNDDFARLRRRWFGPRMFEVRALPYIGYDADSGSYVFNDHAWCGGRRFDLNEYEYFEINGKGIKSSLKSQKHRTGGDFSPDWFPNFYKVYSWQGVAVIAFWLGSLFAQQIRKKAEAFTFLELTGEPGAGKSSLIEFCWKLVGLNYEGVDLFKMTRSAKLRHLSQVSNLPVVLIESDRDSGEGKYSRAADFDQFKTFYDGGIASTRGVANHGNDTLVQTFKGSMLISQNAEVDGSPALLSRIFHNHADKRHHTAETRDLAKWFAEQTPDTVGGFLDVALKNEQRVLDIFFKKSAEFERWFMKEDIATARIAKTHGQVVGLVHALKVIFPNMPNEVLQGFPAYALGRARSRQERVSCDHPIVEQFWDTFNFIEQKSGNPDLLNFSTDDRLISVCLSHFRAICLEYGQEIIDMATLKKNLITSKKHKFVCKNRSVRSKFLDKTVKCWVFER